jgi:hypothetical protein
MLSFGAPSEASVSEDVMTTTKFQFDTVARDEYYWTEIQRITSVSGYSLQDLLRNFPAYIMRRDLPRFVAHYELFKMVKELPGCIVDLGVYRGASFFTFSNLMECFCAQDNSRKVFGFDHFRGLVNFSEDDGRKDEAVSKIEGGYKASLSELEALVEIHNLDNMTPGTARCVLIPGDVRETLPKFLDDHPGLKISLLHLDMDLYEPTKYALETLYSHVVNGGVVCFDEYGLVPWGGETKAVDEFFEESNLRPSIKKFQFAKTPHGYFVK